MHKYQVARVIVHPCASGAPRALAVKAPVILQPLGVSVFHYKTGRILRSGSVVIVNCVRRGRGGAYVLPHSPQHKTEIAAVALRTGNQLIRRIPLLYRLGHIPLHRHIVIVLAVGLFGSHIILIVQECAEVVVFLHIPGKRFRIPCALYLRYAYRFLSSGIAVIAPLLLHKLYIGARNRIAAGKLRQLHRYIGSAPFVRRGFVACVEYLFILAQVGHAGIILAVLAARSKIRRLYSAFIGNALYEYCRVHPHRQRGGFHILRIHIHDKAVHAVSGIPQSIKRIVIYIAQRIAYVRRGNYKHHALTVAYLRITRAV